MKLLDDIIDLLSDENGSLTAALLKTKVLMHKIGHAELSEWVNAELNGYANDAAVPDYRIVGGRVVGNVRNMAMIANDVDLPTSHLPPKLRTFLEEHRLREAMNVLEQMAIGDGRLTMPLRPEITVQIDKALSDGHWIHKGWVEMQPLQIKNGLAKVRARLLDFALKLQDQIGEAQEQDVKRAAEKTDVQAMFQHAVFGDNTTVVIGHANTTQIRNSIKQGDFQSLAAALERHGIAPSDIGDLGAAIAADGAAVDHATKTFGPAVKAWLVKMWGKAVDASWQIELGIAGGALTEALKHFYFGG